MAKRGRPRKNKVVTPVVKKDYTSHAIWAIVLYQVFVTIMIIRTFALVFKTIGTLM